MLSIYVNDDAVIPPDVHEAINDMQAVFGVRNRYAASFEDIVAFISHSSGRGIASQVKASYFEALKEL